VRSDNPKTREFLLRSISRVTINTARAFGIAESMLPEITEIDAPAPPNINNPALRDRLSRVWTEKLGPGVIDTNYRRGSMVAEDFVRFAIDPPIPYVYFKVGGTPAAELAESERTGIPVPFNHSPLFKVDEETAIKAGVKATVVALVEVLRR
jgi:hippurate hydrolase